MDHRIVDAEAGEAEIAGAGLDFVEGEHVGAVFDRCGAAVGDFEDVHPVVVDVAAMEELGGEFAALAAPEGFGRVEANALIGGEVEVLERRRQGAVGGLVG